MYRLIQVPLDGSSFAEQALPLAVGLAQRDAATLQVVRVYVPIADTYLYEQGDAFAGIDRELMEKERSVLMDLVDSIAGRTGLQVTPVLLTGPVPETLARHVFTSGAELLIMTTQGRGPLARFWFGSVADSLIRQSPIPILLVRPQEKAPAISQPPAVRHVLIPLDGSQLAEHALGPALTLGDAEKGEFTLLRVVSAIIPAAFDPISGRVNVGLYKPWHQQLYDLKLQLEAEARDYLKRLAERLRAQSLKVHTRLIAHEHPATAILEIASSLGTDAIALTTHGQGGFKRLLLGSVADKVLRSAAMPVLVCPPVNSSEAIGDLPASRKQVIGPT